MKISNDVLAVLSAAKVSGMGVMLTGQLDRKLYERTNKVLEAAGGKWDRKTKSHVFSISAEDRMEQILLSGEVEVQKDEFNYFPTPPAVLRRLLDVAGVKAGMSVLEPSAGQGAIALSLLDAGVDVMCYEIMEQNADALAKNVRGHANCGMSMVVQADFLQAKSAPIYDRVVMNPPFLNQSDIKHVTHALGFLKQGGLLVAVMSAGVTYRNDARATGFRELIESRNGRIEELPENSFKSSGTNVSTVIAVIPA